MMAGHAECIGQVYLWRGIHRAARYGVIIYYTGREDMSPFEAHAVGP